MFTITQEESNRIQIFKQPAYSHLLVEFTYQCFSVIGLFENLSVNCPYYLIDVVEVGAAGTSDPVNGEIKISPQSTWTAKVYGQDSSSNLFVHNATLIDTYKVKVKGSGCTIYAPDAASTCLDATAVLNNTLGDELSSTNIPSGTSDIIVAPNGIANLVNSAGTFSSATNIPSGANVTITAGDGLARLRDSAFNILKSVATVADITTNITVNNSVATLKNSVATTLGSTSILAEGASDVVAPDATAVVKDTSGNTLATQLIPSGVSEDIVVTTGASILYAYNYGAFTTDQNVSYQTNDDKWVRDNVYNPEIATWDQSLVWSFPTLDPANFTLLLKGSNPDGSGNNIFGNKQRFTDTLGTQTYANNLIIDHYTGAMIYFVGSATSRNFATFNDFATALNVGGYNDFHVGNAKEIFSVMRNTMANFSSFDYAPFSFGSNHNTSTSTTSFRSGSASEVLRTFNGAYMLTIIAKTSNIYCLDIAFRKAFSYNTTTKQMELL